MPDIDSALDQAQLRSGLVVLADTADNAGGGAPGDNVSLLRAMLDRGMQQAAFGAIWDPEVVRLCTAAGTGNRVRLSLGGKNGKASGLPLDITATVRAIRDNHWQDALGTSTAVMGASVWLECNGIDVLVTSLRGQVFTPSAFTGIGIEMESKRFVAVKSSQHFHAGFAPIANAIIFVATPGAIQMNFAEIDYLKRSDNCYFPRVSDPLDRDGDHR
jgi:microcystin degradation protein MlrC